MHIGRPETAEQLDEYFDLRWRILREPWKQPRGSEKDEFEDGADHITARDDAGRLLGIGRLHQSGHREAQIRYMATEEDCRGLGVGRAIMAKLEELAAAYGVERILLNAREHVVGFYERLGYAVVGPGPTMFGEIKHSRMEKVL